MAQDELVDALASKAMGVEPQAPATPPVTAAPSAEAQDKDTPTQAEAAVAAASPADEADAMNSPAMTYKVGDRELTEKQIASTMDRYKALNYQNAQYKPVMEVIKQLEAKYQTSPDQLAKAILEIAESPHVAQASAASVGATPDNTQPQAVDKEDVFRQWEEENSASLPPGYKDINGTMQSLAAMNAETQQMLRAVLAHSDGAVKAAAQANQKTQEQNSINMQRQLANNLDRVQQHFAMSDDQAQDFVNFAEDRGYTMEDFIDGQLLVNVVRDFKNMGTEPELAQLRAQRERRQAFSGSIGSSPGSDSAAGRAAEPEGSTDLDRLAQQIMSQRNQSV